VTRDAQSHQELHGGEREEGGKDRGKKKWKKSPWNHMLLLVTRYASRVTCY